MVSETDVLKALSAIAGPDGRTAVSRSNGIVGLTIRDDKVYLALTGNPRLAEAMETMRVQAEMAIKGVVGVRSALVSLTVEQPAGTAAKPQAGAANPQAEATRPSAPARPAPARNISIPGIARIIALAQSVPLAGAVIVSTPQDLALIDARRGISMFGKTNVPILGVVENMSTFICPHCGGRSDIFAHGGARHEAEVMGVPFLGEVPLSLAIREGADAGRPTVAVAPDSPQGVVYRDIAGRVKAGLEGARTRAAPRITIG